MNAEPIMIGEGEQDDKFEIVSEQEKTYPNFPLRGRQITLRSLAQTVNNPEEYVESLFNFVVDNLLQDVDPDSYVGFNIESSNDVIGKAIYIPWRRKSEMSSRHILFSIERVLNSNESFLLGENVTVNVNITDPIRGQGSSSWSNDKYLPLEAFLQKNIVPVEALPDCLARALVMAKSKSDKDYNKTRYLKNNSIHWGYQAGVLSSCWSGSH
jgi:hypothetical protein